VATGQQARSYPLHSNEGGSKTDSYVWRKVRLTDETGAGRNVKLEVSDGGAYKLVADRVFFDVHEHFDPEFLWYSDYVPPGQTSPGVVRRPSNVANDATEGWLLVAGDKLQAVGIDPGGQPNDISPKWPKGTG
jgi:hypothetical protein